MFIGIGTGIPMFLNRNRIEQLVGMGATFIADARTGSSTLDAVYALGSKTATYSATRGASNPATYFDKNGVMQVLTTSDVRRKTEGYYDETGWHYAPGEFLEGAGTNLIRQSIFATDSNADGRADGWDETVYGTAELLSAATISNISGHQLQRVYHEFTGGEANYSRLLSHTTLNDSITAGASYTFTFLLKGSSTITAGKTFSILVTGLDNAGANKGDTTLSSTALVNVNYSDYVQLSYVWTAPTGSTKCRIMLGYIGAANKPAAGDAVDFTISTVALTSGLYPTTFIPTTTAAVQRNAESLSYASALNFPAPYGNPCLNFDGANASGDDYVSVANSATANQVAGVEGNGGISYEFWALIRSDGENDVGRLFGKINSPVDHNLRTASQSGNNISLQFTIQRATTDAVVNTATDVPINQWHHIVVSWNGGDGADDNAPKLYINGSLSASGTGGAGAIVDDSDDPMIIGNGAAATFDARTFDGFIRRVRIFRNKALSTDDVTALYAGGVYVQNQSSPVTGCTAEYNFAQGTGTELTDTTATANHGTINGATWSKDQHAVTIVMQYAPIMLPNEQDADYKTLLLQLFGATNDRIQYIYSTNANNRPVFQSGSNNNYTSVSTSNGYGTNWSRYGTRTIAYCLSTTADANGKKATAYDNGTLIASGTTYAPPAGSIASTFLIQSSSGQSMQLKSIALFNRQLSATEVTTVHTILD